MLHASLISFCACELISATLLIQTPSKYSCFAVGKRLVHLTLGSCGRADH